MEAHVTRGMAEIDRKVARRIFAAAFEDHDPTIRPREAGGGDASPVSRSHDCDIDLGEVRLWGSVVDQRLDWVR